jgi:hypothetical protein
MGTVITPRPSVSLSVHAPLFGDVRPIERALKDRNHASLDLDLTPGSLIRNTAGRLNPRSFARVRPSSLWIPDTALTTAPADVVVQLPAEWCSQGAPLLVIDAPAIPEGRFADLVAAAKLAEAYRAATDGQLVLGLRARHLAGGRRHLAQLTLLRRSLEEWDLSLALDLSGSFDPQWEAEAAMLRIGSRLALLRIGADALSPAAIDRARVARRALRTAFELSAELPVALAPQRSWWRRLLPNDDRARWNDDLVRLRAMRLDARHVEQAPRRPGRRPSHPFNPSGFA